MRLDRLIADCDSGRRCVGSRIREDQLSTPVALRAVFDGRLSLRFPDMPEKKPQSSVISKIVVFSGIALMCAPVCLAASDPRLPIGVAVVVGLALGVPMLVWGFRLHPNHVSTDCSSRHFWPKPNEAWGILGFLTFFLSYLAPFCVFIPLFRMLPAGDDWGLVMIRIVLVVASVCCTWWWITFAQKKFPEKFGGRISDELVNSFRVSQTPVEPVGILPAAREHWQLVVVAITAFLVATGVVDFNDPWLKIDAGPRRLRGIVRLLVWCRGNPNMVRSSSLVAGLAALGLFAYRITQAYARSGKNRSVPTCSTAALAESSSEGMQKGVQRPESGDL